MDDMIPTDVKIESLIHRSFIHYYSMSNIDALKNPNPKTTRSQINLPAIELIMFYCVFVKGKNIFIYLDTNYKQFQWELDKFFRTLKEH